MSDNSVTLVGSLVRDPTVTTVGKGTPMCQFTVSVSHWWKGPADKSKKEVKSYYEIRCFSDLALNFVESCQRGDSVVVVGKLTSKTFTENGKPVHVVEVMAQHIGLDLLVTSTPLDEST